MSNSEHSGSARIYQFPLSKRLAADRAREQQSAKTLSLARAPSVVCGSGWYHEEAIREAERARNA